MKLVYRQISVALALSGLFNCTAAIPVNSAATFSKLSCQDNVEISVLVQSVWYEHDYRTAFVTFRSQPTVAACYLINDLRIVQETWIRGGDQNMHPETMHVIWCLRALRYITGGINFKGNTKYHFNDSSERESNRRQLLRRDYNEVPFFAVWMSRDSLAIAPTDAQRAIIKKWIEWYAKNSSTFNYNSAGTVDDWYF